MRKPIDGLSSVSRLATMVRVICLFAFLSTPVLAGNIVTELMTDSVATFSDATKLMYFSFFPPESQKKSLKNENIDINEAHKFLESQGIALNKDSKPILRENFARTLIERFELEKSVFTKVTRADRFYFQDAISLGIFAKESRPDETLSTRELLSAYQRASTLSRAQR
jgi:hypothetical protein